MASIRKQAIKIAGRDGAKFIDDYKHIHHKRHDQLQQSVRTIAKKAFWDKISQALSKDPPEWQVIVSILQEARDLLCEIATKDTQEIHDALNMDLIQQMITYGIFDLHKSVDLLVYMIEKIKAYGPPSQDDAVLAWRTDVKSTLDKKEATDMAQFLPRHFSQIMERLTSILNAKRLVLGLKAATKD